MKNGLKMEKTLGFHNRENECIIHEGKEYWISRSVAIVGIILARIGDKTLVLSEKRSMLMDQGGKQSLVCGYIDWDENGFDAIRRETYEETGIDLNTIKPDLIYNNNEQPYYVKTDPDENRQNISLSYIFDYDFGPSGHYCMIESEKFTSSEVDKVEWVNINDLANYDWAFDHDHRIKNALKFLSNK